MSCILNIETSTNVCSVAVSQDGAPIFSEVDRSGPNHAVKLGQFVDQALSFIDSHAIPLDVVAVSGGPGSYTGLRIGVSMAKGVCYGMEARLVSVPTLQLMTVPVLLHKDIEDDALLCPMIDARRMEVYAAVYDRALHELRPVQADVVESHAGNDLVCHDPDLLMWAVFCFHNCANWKRFCMHLKIHKEHIFDCLYQKEISFLELVVLLAAIQ